MHFWIDKRSQGCGFNGRHGVPASLASGRRRRRRNKSMVTPVHRFQSIENSTFSQLRRPHESLESQHSPDAHQDVQYLSNEPVNDAIILSSSPPPALEAPMYNDDEYENVIMNVIARPQGISMAGLRKYSVWASLGITMTSVVAANFYVDYQGPFKILLLCTMGVLCAGLLVYCALTFCKKKPPAQCLGVHVLQPPQPTAVEMEIPEIISQREVIILPMTDISPQSTPEATRPAQNLEQPPPPYHLAIHLPLKDSNCIDFPPPTYESAVR